MPKSIKKKKIKTFEDRHELSTQTLFGCENMKEWNQSYINLKALQNHLYDRGAILKEHFIAIINKCQQLFVNEPNVIRIKTQNQFSGFFYFFGHLAFFFYLAISQFVIVFVPNVPKFCLLVFSQFVCFFLFVVCEYKKKQNALRDEILKTCKGIITMQKKQLIKIK